MPRRPLKKVGAAADQVNALAYRVRTKGMKHTFEYEEGELIAWVIDFMKRLSPLTKDKPRKGKRQIPIEVTTKIL